MSNKQKETTTQINISLSKEILQKLFDGNYNKSQLIINLLKKYFQENKK